MGLELSVGGVFPSRNQLVVAVLSGILGFHPIQVAARVPVAGLLIEEFPVEVGIIVVLRPDIDPRDACRLAPGHEWNPAQQNDTGDSVFAMVLFDDIPDSNHVPARSRGIQRIDRHHRRGETKQLVDVPEIHIQPLAQGPVGLRVTVHHHQIRFSGQLLPTGGVSRATRAWQGTAQCRQAAQQGGYLRSDHIHAFVSPFIYPGTITSARL